VLALKKAAPRKRPSRGFDADWRNSIGYLLRDTTRLLRRVTAARLAPHGVTMTQYFLLRQLWEMEAPTQRELARRIAVPESALATLLDALEADGLVMRKRSTSDRRKTHVHLTPQANDLREALFADGAAVLDGALDGVSDRAVAELRRTLRQMKLNLEALEVRL
jgi:DNA-binding MarR family transcriptional regulator